MQLGIAFEQPIELQGTLCLAPNTAMSIPSRIRGSRPPNAAPDRGLG